MWQVSHLGLLSCFTISDTISSGVLSLVKGLWGSLMVSEVGTAFSLVPSCLALLDGEVLVTGEVLFLRETGFTDCCILEGWMQGITGSSFLHLCS